MITLEKSTPWMKMMSLEDAFEEMVFTKIFPVIQGRSWVLYVVFCLLSLLAICSLILFALSFISRRAAKTMSRFQGDFRTEVPGP